MDFMKVDPSFTLNVKVRAAGVYGGFLFMAVLGVNALHHRDGRLPAREATPEHLAWRGNMTAGQAKKALARCVDAGLVRHEPDGALLIVGWDENWKGALSATERTRKWREARKLGRNAGGDGSVTDGDAMCTDETVQREGGSDRENDRPKRPTPSPSRAGSGRSSGRQVAGFEETDRLLAKIRGASA